MSHIQILREFEQKIGKLSKEGLKTCLKRTAFSLWWRVGQLTTGSNEYLIEDDNETLSKEMTGH